MFKASPAVPVLCLAATACCMVYVSFTAAGFRTTDTAAGRSRRKRVSWFSALIACFLAGCAITLAKRYYP